jgi:hypothetical protein
MAPPFQLVLLDTTGIQEFVFRSNRLRENVAGSYLVACATRNWVFEALEHSNVRGTQICRDVRIEEDGAVEAELLYAGGGKTQILFRSRNQAHAFLRRLSKRLLLEAPGLRLDACCQPFDWQQQPEGLHAASQRCAEGLLQQKRAAEISEPLLGLSVTRSCGSTGLPAVAFSPAFADEESYAVSREVLQKQGVRDTANQRLRDELNLAEGFTFPGQLEDLGRSFGEFSYIGVIHADGNGMGKRISDLGRGLPNRQYIELVRDFSETLHHAGLRALQETVEHLRLAVDTVEAVLPKWAVAASGCGRRIVLKRDNGQIVLPLRPLIYGGDDVLLVCDGRIAIPLALFYLSQFEKHTNCLPDHRGNAFSCAGVAIVKSHYPFARAVDLAHQLCGSAKSLIRSHQVDASGLDWHFANSGLAGGLDEIRERELCTPEGLLNLRPVLVGEEHSEARTWKTVERGIRAFRDERWRAKRNKVKALRDALRQGPEATQRFCEKYLRSENQQLPDLTLSAPKYRKQGWLQVDSALRSAYFDSIELADFIIPLSGSQADPAAEQPGPAGGAT